MEDFMFFELKQFIRNLIIYLFMSPKNNIADLAIDEYECNDNVKYIINSSIVTQCMINGDVKYFRECRIHKRFKEYFTEAIDDYFQNICKYEKKEFERIVRADVSCRANYRKLCRITSIFNKHLIEILSGEYCDYASAGLPSLNNSDYQKEFIDFITYISCIIISYKANAYIPAGTCENGSANKQLSTYKLAELLGVSDLITPVHVCKSNISGKTRIGTLMDVANGQTPAYITPDKRQNYKKETFLKDLTNLEYLDGICYQLDHRLDNYNVIENNGIIVGVEAFDNDANRTFFPTSKFPSSTYAGASCILTNQGRVNRPYIDANLAEKILSIDSTCLYDAVGIYLSSHQFRALFKRIIKLQNAIRETSKERNDFLVYNWSNVNTDCELDEKYGTTYFNLYVNDTLMLQRKAEFEKTKNHKE